MVIGIGKFVGLFCIRYHYSVVPVVKYSSFGILPDDVVVPVVVKYSSVVILPDDVVVLVVVVIVVLGIMGTAKTAILKKCCKIKADIARKFFFSSSIC